MAEQKVHVVVFKSGENDHWIAQCLEIDVSTFGDSYEHALEMAKEAIELHIEDMTKEDLDTLYQPIEGEPRVQSISIDAPTLLHP
jgi:predicted RNase H-like HicB family nuclease